MNEKEILSVSLASLLKIYPSQAEDIAFEGCFWDIGRGSNMKRP